MGCNLDAIHILALARVPSESSPYIRNGMKRVGFFAFSLEILHCPIDI